MDKGDLKRLSARAKEQGSNIERAFQQLAQDVALRHQVSDTSMQEVKEQVDQLNKICHENQELCRKYEETTNNNSKDLEILKDQIGILKNCIVDLQKRNQFLEDLNASLINQLKNLVDGLSTSAIEEQNVMREVISEIMSKVCNRPSAFRGRRSGRSSPNEVAVGSRRIHRKSESELPSKSASSSENIQSVGKRQVGEKNEPSMLDLQVSKSPKALVKEKEGNKVNSKVAVSPSEEVASNSTDSPSEKVKNDALIYHVTEKHGETGSKALRINFAATKEEPDMDGNLQKSSFSNSFSNLSNAPTTKSKRKKSGQSACRTTSFQTLDILESLEENDWPDTEKIICELKSIQIDQKIEIEHSEKGMTEQEHDAINYFQNCNTIQPSTNCEEEKCLRLPSKNSAPTSTENVETELCTPSTSENNILSVEASSSSVRSDAIIGSSTSHQQTSDSSQSSNTLDSLSFSSTLSSKDLTGQEEHEIKSISCHGTESSDCIDSEITQKHEASTVVCDSVEESFLERNSQTEDSSQDQKQNLTSEITDSKLYKSKKSKNNKRKHKQQPVKKTSTAEENSLNPNADINFEKSNSSEIKSLDALNTFSESLTANDLQCPYERRENNVKDETDVDVIIPEKLPCFNSDDLGQNDQNILLQSTEKNINIAEISKSDRTDTEESTNKEHGLQNVETNSLTTESASERSDNEEEMVVSSKQEMEDVTMANSSKGEIGSQKRKNRRKHKTKVNLPRKSAETATNERSEVSEKFESTSANPKFQIQTVEPMKENDCLNKHKPSTISHDNQLIAPLTDPIDSETSFTKLEHTKSDDHKKRDAGSDISGPKIDIAPDTITNTGSSTAAESNNSFKCKRGTKTDIDKTKKTSKTASLPENITPGTNNSVSKTNKVSIQSNYVSKEEKNSKTGSSSNITLENKRAPESSENPSQANTSQDNCNEPESNGALETRGTPKTETVLQADRNQEANKTPKTDITLKTISTSEIDIVPEIISVSENNSESEKNNVVDNATLTKSAVNVSTSLEIDISNVKEESKGLGVDEEIIEKRDSDAEKASSTTLSPEAKEFEPTREYGKAKLTLPPEVQKESKFQARCPKLTTFRMETSDSPVIDASKQEKDPKGNCVQCNSSATQRCANCRQVYYCKRDCQREHWKNGHKNNCKPYKIENDFILGRRLVATRDFRAGEVIFKDEPLLIGPKQVTEPVCLGCYKRVDGSYRCRKCTWPLCGPACENAPDHQPECVVGKEIGSPIDIQDFNETNHFYEVVTTLRALTLKKRSPKKYAELLSKVSHYEERKGSDIYNTNQKRVVNMLRNYFMLVDFPTEDIDASEASIHRMTGIIDTNSVDIPLAETEIEGVYPTYSLLEHSCTPNTKYKFSRSRTLTVKAAVDIRQGEHLSTIYTQMIWGTAARRDFLKNTRFFLCTCRRCADPTELGTNFSAIRCQKCPNGFLMSGAPLDEKAMWICSSCSSIISSEEAMEINRLLGDEVDKALISPKVDELEKLIERASSTQVHPNHFHLFPVKHSLLQMLGRDDTGLDDETVKKKEKLCQEFLKTCTALDPGMSKLGSYAGIALYEYHLAVLGRARIGPSEQQVDKAALKKDFDTAKALLQQCIKVLQDEPDDKPETQLRTLAQENLIELNQWAAV